MSLLALKALMHCSLCGETWEIEIDPAMRSGDGSGYDAVLAHMLASTDCGVEHDGDHVCPACYDKFQAQYEPERDEPGAFERWYSRQH